MKLKNSYFYTLRETVKDEDSNSGNLLVRSGLVKKSSSGVYMYLPMGLKVLKNIQEIIREEMNKTGAQEVLMPSLIPEEVYEASGRRKGFGNSMFSLRDRFDKPFVLGPTHEELFAIAAGMKIRSYKDMPFNIYQFQNKFRDEPRPRFGLIRVREFIMKDAYSFDVNEAGLDLSYQKMFNAYKASFDRMGVKYTIVKADTGVMGGLLSEEFQALSPIGEDTLVVCDHCDYSRNLEIAECLDEGAESTEAEAEKELVFTPHAKTIEEISAYLKQPAEKFVKTLIYLVDQKPVACMVKGNREVNETKLQKLFGALEVTLADAETVRNVTGAEVGFAGPMGLSIPVVMDNEIKYMKNFIVGANQTDHHYINVNLSDFTPTNVVDLRSAMEGDNCPICHGTLHYEKGIEVGNTFKLGTKYSKAMNLQYLDENNQLQDVWMGSYGIGPGRCMAAIAEQNYDEKGLIWPISVAPYKVAIVVINMKDENQVAMGNQLHDQLSELGIDTLLDDRDERAGVKFNDMELIGIPVRITIGKALAEGNVEVKLRKEQESQLVAVSDVVNTVQTLLK